ncbi:arsenic resistance N-acetyltransferase ArsN2 [Imperialibacter roseus]|uniref:Arsenic resistance N-acetyltransferase ArsN2 n=1 Tax=Imperialibacter roseus TaxID=1324217 RepID=A0ABZ0IPJ8_9BACT|nr:arsenic resistance N-acetyltransferase ArsN2 [Imperialibacter roseus]WOK05482.1 arsenic resistance N-acetyltransferase ArsN2 [Imperialibacter roseus]
MNTTQSSIQFRLIKPSELAVATALLEQASLVVSDISEKVKLFGLFSDNSLLALAGLEVFGNEALLRSVCVPAQEKAKGYGQQIIRTLENDAARNGITDLYLLTTTASKFFERIGYKVADRNTASDAIKNTSEFSDLCPSTAVFMHKTLCF